MPPFNPATQNITFYAADGETLLYVPIPSIDMFNAYLASVCVNYGTQLGAAIIMLLVLVIATPSTKLRRPSGLLQVLVLVLCIIRMALLSAYFFSDFVEFYNVNSGDYSTVPSRYYVLSITGNTFSLLLIIAVEICLMHQAWAMVALWPDLVRYIIVVLSVCISLMALGWRLASLVFQNIAILSSVSYEATIWVAQWAAVANALSICWFCALFNAKLVAHLIRHRGILPVGRSVTPMEVLVMTNGVLMIIPAIFAGLEFEQLFNFEASSWTLSSVALMLPLGTLAAQRVSQRYGIASLSDDMTGTHSTGLPHHGHSHGGAALAPSLRPLKGGTSSSYTGGSTRTDRSTAHQVSISSSARRDPIDVELGEIDGFGAQVRVNRDFESREEHLW